MSFRVMSAVWDHYQRGGSELLALVALADWSDEDGNCYPSIAAISRKTRLSRSQTQRVVHRLIEEGAVTVIGNITGGAPGSTRRYKINVSKLTGSANATPTGRTHATGSADATGRTHAQDGSHPCTYRGSTHATQTIIEPSITINRKKAAQTFVLPSWIPKDTWTAYCDVRKAKRAKNEPHALGLILKDLETFKAAGHDPIDVLNNSIKSGWAGVFEPRAKAGTALSNASDKKPWEGAR